MDRKSFSFCQFVSLQQTSDKLKALIKNVWRLQWIKLNNKIMRSERRERRTEFEWKDRPSVSFQECRWIKQKSNKLSTVRISGNLCLFAVRFFCTKRLKQQAAPIIVRRSVETSLTWPEFMSFHNFRTALYQSLLEGCYQRHSPIHRPSFISLRTSKLPQLHRKKSFYCWKINSRWGTLVIMYVGGCESLAKVFFLPFLRISTRIWFSRKLSTR